MAGEIGGDLVVKFEAQISDFVNKINKASAEFDKIQVRMSKSAKKSKEVVSAWKQMQIQGNQLYRTLFNIKTVALVAFGGMVTSVSKVVAETEKMKASLNVLTGGQGGQAFDALSSWARTVNITTEEAVNTYKNFRAVGLQPTIKDMETILDLANAFGGGTDTIKRLTKAIGDVQAKGKLMGEEVRQLTNIGVPIRAILLESGAVTADMINDIGRANISAQKIMSALFNYTEKNFKGMTSEIMKTWAGTVTQMEDTWWRMKLTVGENMIEAGAGKAGENFSNTSDTRATWLASFGNSLGNIISSFDALADTVDLVVAVFAKVIEVGTLAIKALSTMLGASLDSIGSAVSSVFDRIGTGFLRFEKAMERWNPFNSYSKEEYERDKAIISKNETDALAKANGDFDKKLEGTIASLDKSVILLFKGASEEQKARFKSGNQKELPDAGGMISGYKNLDEVINSIESKFNNLKKKVPQTYDEMRKGADEWAEAQKKAIEAYLPDSKLSKAEQADVRTQQFKKIEEARKLMQDEVNRTESKKSAGILKDIDTQLAKNKDAYFNASKAYDAYIQNLKDGGKVPPEFFEKNKEKLEELREMLQQREDMEKESYKRRADALYDYAKENEQAFSNINSLATNMIESLEDTLTDFFMTGKMEWQDYLDTISRMIMKSMIQQMITSPIAKGLSDYLGGISLFSGGSTAGTEKKFANGGVISEHIVGYGLSTGTKYHMGEAGTEVITPLSKLGGGGSNTNVRVEVVNRSGTPVQAKQSYQTTSAGEQVIQVVLDALSRNKSGLRDQIRSI